MVRIILFGQHLHLGKSIRVYQAMWNTDLHFYASVTFCYYFSVPVLVMYSHDTLETLTCGQDRFSSIIYAMIRPVFWLHRLYDMLH